MKLWKYDWFFFIMFIALFCGAVLLGEHLPVLSPEIAKALDHAATERLGSMAKMLKGQPAYIWVIKICLNNLAASFTAILLGMICPILPILQLFGNGLIVGIFQHKVEIASRLSIGHYYLGLLPHGIFEIPAFCVAVLLGTRLGMINYRLLWRYFGANEDFSLFKEGFRENKAYFLQRGRYYAAFITVLLFAAAILESTVSPLIIRR